MAHLLARLPPGTLPNAKLRHSGVVPADELDDCASTQQPITAWTSIRSYVQREF